MPVLTNTQFAPVLDLPRLQRFSGHAEKKTKTDSRNRSFLFMLLFLLSRFHYLLGDTSGSL
ncbi:hypothetical protein CHI04_14115 [Bacillus safensis]|nr:hypothetical protein CHI04_14115 [Bacillus safensis]